MPGKDNTGPTGEGPAGRRMGPCDDPTNAEEAERTERVDVSKPNLEEKSIDVRGVGRGGKPWGCGRGHCGGRQHHGHERRRRCCEEG